MTIAEVAEACYDLPIKIFVFDNDGYASIRQTQDRFFDGRYLGEGPRSGVTCPNLELIARKPPNAFQIQPSDRVVAEIGRQKVM